MSDISLSPSKSQVGVSPRSPHPSTRRFSMNASRHREEKSEHESPDVEDDVEDDDPCSDIEEPAIVGMKRSRSSDHENTPALGLATNRYDPVAAIVTRAKRLRISDDTTENRDREVRQMRTKPKEEDVVHDTVALGSVALGQPSLSGLPEELVLEVIYDLDFFDIMTLRKTNRRLAYITHARILWITHFNLLLDHICLPESPTTFTPSLLSTPAVEHTVLRPHIFDYKWFRSPRCRENPASSRVLSTGWSAPQDVRCPVLLPGGRWLTAVCDDTRSSNSGVCLWDLDHGKLKWLPEAQVEAEGRVLSIDVKMDRKGGFALMAVFSEKFNVAMTLVFRVDVYKIDFVANSDTFGFHHIDTLPLNDRRASEVQIYPQHGHVLLSLFDRILIWAYTPEDKCAWFVTSHMRHQQRRFSHRSAHAITRTHAFILVADGDESVLRAFQFPPLMNRPAQLSALGLYILPPYIEIPLPSFSMSLLFSTERLVDTLPMLEPQESSTQATLAYNVTVNGATVNPTHTGPGAPAAEPGEQPMASCPNPSGRGVLFIDAASCDSYLMCSYPIHHISAYPGSSEAVFWTTRDRGEAREQARSGSFVTSQTTSGSSRPFAVLPQFGGRTDSGSTGDALWIGTLGEISSSLTAAGDSLKGGVRNVVLMRGPGSSEGLSILSALAPILTHPGSGQSSIADVEQGVAKTVRWKPSIQDPTTPTNMTGHSRIEEATVDQISGRVCIVENTATKDPASSSIEFRCALRLLEYA